MPPRRRFDFSGAKSQGTGFGGTASLSAHFTPSTAWLNRLHPYTVSSSSATGTECREQPQLLQERYPPPADEPPRAPRPRPCGTRRLRLSCTSFESAPGIDATAAAPGSSSSYSFISKLGGTIATQRSTGAGAPRLELIIRWSEVRILPGPSRKPRSQSGHCIDCRRA